MSIEQVCQRLRLSRWQLRQRVSGGQIKPSRHDPNSFKALNQAVEAHRQGRYDDAAAKCRVALDPFFEYEERSEPDGSKRKIPIVKKSWETRAGEKTYQWLNGTLGVLKAAANPSHHTPNSHFDQVESQMLIAVTAAVINYGAYSRTNLNGIPWRSGVPNPRRSDTAQIH